MTWGDGQDDTLGRDGQKDGRTPSDRADRVREAGWKDGHDWMTGSGRRDGRTDGRMDSVGKVGRID